MKEKTTDMIRVRVTDSERARIQALADKRTNGNVSSLIKGLIWQAVREEEENETMKETRYELKTASVEVGTRQEIANGCAHEHPDPTLIAAFRTKEEALDALRQYRSTARHYDGWIKPYWFVTEYWVEENTYRIDEDGDADWIEGGDVWEYAEWDEDYTKEEGTMTVSEFVEELFNASSVTPERIESLEDAEKDLENFRADEWEMPEDITAEEYMEAGNALVDQQ